MKKVFIILLMFILVVSLNAGLLKPYVLAGTETGDIAGVSEKVIKLLKANGFEVIGKYSPMESKNRKIICVTHDLIKKSILETKDDLAAFATALRIGVYNNGKEIEVSYTNPLYWGNSFLRESYPKVQKNYLEVEKSMKAAFKDLAVVKNLPYGSKKGLTEIKLRKYKYMMGMPKFTKVIALKKQSNFETMIERIRKNLKKGLGGSTPIYEVNYPGKQLTVFGVGLKGKSGEKKFIPIIDKKNPKHIAAWPYEMLVMKDKVVMLHGRFRIAIAFPDLKMGTFMKIVSTPKRIMNSLRILTVIK